MWVLERTYAHCVDDSKLRWECISVRGADLHSWMVYVVPYFEWCPGKNIMYQSKLLELQFKLQSQNLLSWSQDVLANYKKSKNWYQSLNSRLFVNLHDDFCERHKRHLHWTTIQTSISKPPLLKPGRTIWVVEQTHGLLDWVQRCTKLGMWSNMVTIPVKKTSVNKEKT